MYKYWLFISIFSANFYFTIRAVLGLNNMAEDSDLFYRMYLFMIFIAILIIFLKQINLIKPTVSKNEIWIFVIFGVVLFQFILSGYNNSSFNENAVTFFIYFIIWVIPVCLSSIIILKKNLTLDLLKFLEIYMILITIGVTRAYIIPSLTGVPIEYYGGATYQTASYLAAFAFGLNLFLVSSPVNIKKELYFSKIKLFKIIYFAMFPIQFSAVFLSGGRGGGILLIIFIGLFLIKNLIKLSLINIIFSLFFVILFSAISPLIFNALNSNIMFSNGFNRVFEFVSLSEGINWSGTSNRDQVYLNALSLIMDKPILGYGLYGFWNYTGYPHNIFLEILLQGGIVFLLICTIISLHLLWKLSKIYKVDNLLVYLISIILIYSLVHLSFSGTYLIHSEFWFCIFTLILYNFNKDHPKHLLY